MTTNSFHGSAEIYNFADFAAKLRPNRERRAEVFQSNEIGSVQPPVTYGNAWYHEEAIQDSDFTRKH